MLASLYTALLVGFVLTGWTRSDYDFSEGDYLRRIPIRPLTGSAFAGNAIEVRRYCDERFRVDDFSQAGSDQAPYEEVFLTEDGSAVASELTGELDRVGEAVRVAFYFHFLDRRKPLNTSYGPVPVPAIEPMPTRLARLVPYEPVT